ncbi:hypothetical protein GALMADRAFT_227512 [Galerina marginata CBS 339.88]|uniref:Uncharacterized protein n=1 Tax=Galerina marginata (strain CBS 339.88) TaxID=685588 RepID=A0A067T3I7_GALM3|nr:hypothetical protein GALMADRAFT_227512 [Galerina marginata CBS 339.88]
MQSAKLSPLHQNADLFWSHSAVSTSEGREASTSVRTTSDLPTWVHLPDMGITSKTGPESDEEAEDDELASDHDGDQVLPAKRQKTLSVSTNRRGKRNQSPNPSLLPLEVSPSHVAPGSNDGTTQLALALNASFTAAGPSNIPAIQTPPPEVVASSPLPPGKVKPSTQTQLPGSWVNAVAATNRSSQFTVPPDRESSLLSPAPSNPPALSSLSQKRKILVPGTKRRSRNETTNASEILATRALPFAEPISASTSSSRERLIAQTSRSYLSRHAKTTTAPAKSSAYQANQDEIEDWTEATVASLVFRKPPYSRRAEAEVRMMNAVHLRRMIDARQMVPPTGNEATIANRSVKPVAIPAISLSAQTEALIESIFGPEDSTVRSQVIRPTAKNKRRLYSKSRASSTSDAHTSRTSELPTPPAEFAPDPIQNHVIVIDSPSPPTQSSTLPTIASDSKPQGRQSPVIGLTEDSDTERNNLTIATNPSAEGARTTNSLPHLNWTFDVYPEPLYPPTISPTSSRHPSPFSGAISHTSTNPDTPPQFLPIPNSSARVIRSRSREAQGGSPDSRPAEDLAALVSSSVSGTEEDPRTFQSFPPTDDFHALKPRIPVNVVKVANPPASLAQQSYDAEQLQGGMDQRAVSDSDNMYVDEPEISTALQTERQPSHAISAPLLSESQHASRSDSDPLPSEVQPTPATFSLHHAVENISPTFTPQHSPPANIRPVSYRTWELTEQPSQPIPLPTVFDPGYLKSRTQGQDAYHLGAELEAEAIIGEINPIEGGGALDGMDTDEDEVDELADDNEDSMVIEPLGGSISDARKAEGIQNSVSVGTGNNDTSTDEGVEDIDQLIDSPEAFAAEVEQWRSVLQSLLKGKKKFGDEDMQHLKDTLQSIHAHRTLIGPTSALAETVYAIANLRAEDIPDKDQVGLRALARKSVRAWGIRKQRNA